MFVFIKNILTRKKPPERRFPILISNFCGEGGIRTLGRVSPTLAFQASTLNHSATSPYSPAYADGKNRRPRASWVSIETRSILIRIRIVPTRPPHHYSHSLRSDSISLPGFRQASKYPAPACGRKTRLPDRRMKADCLSWSAP